MILSDRIITEYANMGMITPFARSQVRAIDDKGVQEKIISYGVSSYGYDVRAVDEWKVFTNVNNSIIDPKRFDDDAFVTQSGNGYCMIPPNSFALSLSVEYMKMPKNVIGICLGKSTYARCGIIVNVTPLEPEWEGQIVLEFSNTTTLPAKVYSNEGVAQILFLESQYQCDVTYKDRNGKYQHQNSIVLPRL
jgi:dCTP deaminase